MEMGFRFHVLLFCGPQEQKLKEMDAIMYADAAKQVQRHILRGGELLDRE